MRETRVFRWAFLTVILVLAACQPIQRPESSGEKVLKALAGEGVTLNMTEFAAESGLFTMNAPPDWVTAEHADGSGVIMASSAAALARFQQGDALEAGDAILSTTLAPMAFFAALLLEVEPEMSTADLGAAILPAFSNPEGATVSEPEVIALGGGRQAAAIMTSAASAEGALVAFEISPGVVALNTIVVHPGELAAEDMETAARVIVGSLEFIGTVDELIEAIDPVQPPDAAFG